MTVMRIGLRGKVKDKNSTWREAGGIGLPRLEKTQAEKPPAQEGGRYKSKCEGGAKGLGQAEGRHKNQS